MIDDTHPFKNLKLISAWEMFLKFQENLQKVNIETYLGKCILKDFEGTTNKGTITKLLKNKDDEMPFLQLDM